MTKSDETLELGKQTAILKGIYQNLSSLRYELQNERVQRERQEKEEGMIPWIKKVWSSIRG
jgi:hypothetical protein